MEDKSHHTEGGIHRPAGYDPSGSSGGFEPSAKLVRLFRASRVRLLLLMKSIFLQRARIENLAHLRLNPCSINFPDGARESRGGHATVSKGGLYKKYMYKWQIEKLALDKKLGSKQMKALGRKLERVSWSRRVVSEPSFFLLNSSH